MHEDNPFHFLRGQYFLQKLLTGKDRFDEPNLPSPVFIVPGQKVSIYKNNASEEALAPVKPITTNTLRKNFEKYLSDFGIRQSFYKHNSWVDNFWMIPDFLTHPAVSDTFMALFNRIFYENLGVSADIESYYLYVALATSAGLFFIFIFTEEVFGVKAAVISAISYALYPFLFAEAHFNVKDPVQMAFFTGAAISFYFFIKRKFSIKWLISFILSTYLALGTKWNIFFIPLFLLPWVFVVWKKNLVKSKLFWFKTILFSLFGVISAFLLLIITWPFLWQDTLVKLYNTFTFYSSLGFTDARVEQIISSFSLPLGFDLTGLIRLFAMTPPLILLFFVLGSFALIFKKINTKFKEGLFLFLWLLVISFIISRIEVAQFGSLRSYIEILPPMTILAGVGGSYLISILKKKLFSYLIIGIYLLVLSLTIYKMHPNENLYFNSLTGGISNAKILGIFDWESTYDNVFRQGVDWLNNNSAYSAKLAFVDGTNFAISPLWLRDDIKFGSFFSGFGQKGEYIMALYYPRPPSAFAYLYAKRFLKPVHEIKVDSQTILYIWKNDSNHLYNGFRKETNLNRALKFEVETINKRILSIIKIGGVKTVTRLVLEGVAPDCLTESGIWQFQNQKTGVYISPGIINLDNGLIELDFPAQAADSILYWDIEGKACLNNAKVDKLFVLN